MCFGNISSWSSGEKPEKEIIRHSVSGGYLKELASCKTESDTLAEQAQKIFGRFNPSLNNNTNTRINYIANEFPNQSEAETLSPASHMQDRGQDCFPGNYEPDPAQVARDIWVQEIMSGEREKHEEELRFILWKSTKKDDAPSEKPKEEVQEVKSDEPKVVEEKLNATEKAVEEPKKKPKKKKDNKGKFITKGEQLKLEKELSQKYREWRKWKIDNKEGYVSIPIELLDSNYLSDPEMKVYCKLFRYITNETGVTFVKDETLAKATGKGLSSVQRILESLEKKKMIRRLSVSTLDRKICFLPYPEELYEHVPKIRDVEEEE